jgi:hypothetical protein
MADGEFGSRHGAWLFQRNNDQRLMRERGVQIDAFQLLEPQLGQRIQPAPEQSAHLLRRHRVADVVTGVRGLTAGIEVT